MCVCVVAFAGVLDLGADNPFTIPPLKKVPPARPLCLSCVCGALTRVPVCPRVCPRVCLRLCCQQPVKDEDVQFVLNRFCFNMGLLTVTIGIEHIPMTEDEKRAEVCGRAGVCLCRAVPCLEW